MRYLKLPDGCASSDAGSRLSCGVPPPAVRAVAAADARAIADRVLPRNDIHLLIVLLRGAPRRPSCSTSSRRSCGQLLLYLRTRFDAKLTLGFVEHMLRLPYDFFERRQVGDLLMRVSSVRDHPRDADRRRPLGAHRRRRSSSATSCSS